MNEAFKKILLVNFGTPLEVANYLETGRIPIIGAINKFHQPPDQQARKAEDFTNPDAQAVRSFNNFNSAPWQDPRTDASAVSTHNNKVLSLLGTPVFSNFNLSYGNKKLSHAINGVLFTVSTQKNIVTTVVQGRKGTVKEFICEGDWKINVKIVISAINNSYPADLTKEINNMLAINDTIQIHSWYLNDIFNIRDVVVVPRKFEQHQGYQNMGFIDFDFLSDEPENLD